MKSVFSLLAKVLLRGDSYASANLGQHDVRDVLEAGYG